jgi:hypothetical protein
MSDSHPSVPAAALNRCFHRPGKNLEGCVRAPLVPSWARLWLGLSNARKAGQ